MADGSTSSAWGRRRQLPLLMQTEAAECALVCLAMVARYHGHEMDLASMRRRFGTSLKGVDLVRLIEMTHSLGFDARPLRTELAYLPHASAPCILHWDLSHFVVLRRVSRKGAEIYDPALGRYVMPLSEVSKHFTGIVLELSPGTDFAPIKENKPRVSLRALTGRITGLTGAVVQIFGLALALEVLSLALPFQMQWVIDQVMLSSDKSLLLVLTIGFLLVVVLQTSLMIARAWLLSWLGATLSAQWVTNLFGHLLRLPMDYFEKRHIGDVVSKFSSVQSIQNTLTSSFVEATLDGLMGLLALAILCVYSMPLTGYVIAAVTLYVLLRWALYRTLRRINEEQLIYAARQQSELIESVRGVQAIKLANKQGERKARLANATLQAAKRSMLIQRINLSFGGIYQGVFGAQRILLIAFGAYLAIGGKFSVGMLVAFVAYADQFSTKIGSLIDKVVDFRMLGLHAERIADIALAQPESNFEGTYTGEDPIPGIEVRGLGFRYSPSEPWIFRNLNLTFEAGQSIAITGVSGCGKSTLGKIILGLLEPEEGTVLIGGINIRRLGMRRYRDFISAVAQDDQLFAGTIADNISFFNATADLEQVIGAAKSAAIHEEITAMPMGYETQVGDMGSVFSGGQKQRMLLARALYRKPKIILLDEATSHLDIDNCRAIDDKIASLQITRIIIAHREETISSAKRCIRLQSFVDTSQI